MKLQRLVTQAALGLALLYAAAPLVHAQQGSDPGNAASCQRYRCVGLELRADGIEIK